MLAKVATNPHRRNLCARQWLPDHSRSEMNLQRDMRDFAIIAADIAVAIVGSLSYDEGCRRVSNPQVE